MSPGSWPNAVLLVDLLRVYCAISNCLKRPCSVSSFQSAPAWSSLALIPGFSPRPFIPCFRHPSLPSPLSLIFWMNHVLLQWTCTISIIKGGKKYCKLTFRDYQFQDLKFHKQRNWNSETMPGPKSHNMLPVELTKSRSHGFYPHGSSSGAVPGKGVIRLGRAYLSKSLELVVCPSLIRYLGFPYVTGSRQCLGKYKMKQRSTPDLLGF